jgi:ribosome production factor 2
MSVRQDCSLFIVGTHQKKRPDNLIIGRLFADHLLDMFEFGVSNYKGI